MSEEKNTNELTEKEIVETLDKEAKGSSDVASKNSKTKKSKAVKKTSKFKGLKSEFKRISWPTKKETAGSTIAVVVVSIILCVIIAVVDSFIQNGLNLLFSIGA